MLIKQIRHFGDKTGNRQEPTKPNRHFGDAIEPNRTIDPSTYRRRKPARLPPWEGNSGSPRQTRNAE